MAKETHQELFDLAETQQGLFTAQQAVDLGIQKQNHKYCVESGEWIRECRGVFRLRNFPVSNNQELVKWYLWSRNKSGVPQGTLSHQTALSVYGLSDALPHKIYMTVPRDFRRKADRPKELILYLDDLPYEDVVLREGFQITTPIRTVLDLARSRTVPDTILGQSLDEGFKQGIIDSVQLKRRIQRDESGKLSELLSKLGSK
jgi:predicted transcriptional regulator of viral defense system